MSQIRLRSGLQERVLGITLDIQYLENILGQAKAVHEIRLELLARYGEDNVHPE